MGSSGYAWLSVATAVATLALKGIAAYITGSVGLYSDALESIVNLVAALLAVYAIRVATRPADEAFPHGYDKAEYFSSGFEGALILVAAFLMGFEAIRRLLAPAPLVEIELGLGISMVACAMNFVVSRALMQGAKKHESIALEADAHHLMTDVWTTIGVAIAVVLVRVTGWQWLDPVAALIVAANVVRIGVALVRRSSRGLLDAALPSQERAAVDAMLEEVSAREGAQFHAVRTRQAGARRFIELHVVVPGRWSVQRGHDLCEKIEEGLRNLGPRTTVLTHLEPLEDPKSYADQQLDRDQAV
jgi:cation diffusion facilitator family transporter